VKILARQLVIDMYDCKPEKLNDISLLSAALKNALDDNDFHPLQTEIKNLKGNHSMIFLPLSEGHLIVHVYPLLKYCAVDLFICEQNILSEKAILSLRKVIKPDKIKITYLCRGDFGTISDMRPHTKVKITTLRRIHNTGVRVIHLLPGRNFVKKLRRKNKGNKK
jgi:S-adenosylmethionine decarboxylase